MPSQTLSRPVFLSPRQTVSLDPQPGQRLESRSGTLWVTQDHDLRDLILEPGDSITLEQGRHTLVSALGEASFVLYPVAAATAARARRRWSLSGPASGALGLAKVQARA